MVNRTVADIHLQKGLSCHSCHGGNPTAGADGDPEAAHDKSRGWSGKPTRLQVPDLCGKCHSDAAFMKTFNPKTRVDQLAEYRTSEHGRRNAEGDTRTAVCVDCHGVHGILKVSDPRAPVYPTALADTCARCHNDESLMGAYGVPSGQHAQYRTSVHAAALYEKGDISAPTCNDCHGSHGAAPPGVTNVANVCGSCHGREASLFREVEARKGLDLEPCIQCVICHSNHAVLPPTQEMIGVGEKSTCTGCHTEGDAGWTAASRMGDDLKTLRAKLHDAHEILDRAERAGVEVSPDKFALQKAADSLVESRVLVHGFDLDRFVKVSTEGIAAAEEGVTAGNRAFAELRFRRNGLALSLVLIAAVIGALVLTIRRIEK
jgi:predicted CXXCH cytochrome family protein